jgi:hypothetical protein
MDDIGWLMLVGLLSTVPVLSVAMGLVLLRWFAGLGEGGIDEVG